MTGLDQQLGVGVHEGDGHRHLRPIGQDEVGIVPKLLDHREDVVPATGVETCDVVPKLVEDLVHLEGGEDGLDEDRGPDRALRDPEPVLGPDEDVIPQPGLEMGLQLGQVEVGAGAAVDGGPAPMEQIEPEVEERSRHRLLVHQEVLLLEMPAAGPHHERRHLVRQRIALLLALESEVCRGRRRPDWPGPQAGWARWGWWHPRSRP